MNQNRLGKVKKLEEERDGANKRISELQQFVETSSKENESIQQGLDRGVKLLMSKFESLEAAIEQATTSETKQRLRLAPSRPNRSQSPGPGRPQPKMRF